MKKEAIEFVIPLENLLTNLAIEFAKRMHRNGESLASLMDEAKKRFPKLTLEDQYNILCQLETLGFEIDPEFWLLFSTNNKKAEVLQKIIKKGKSYGSRYEDFEILLQNNKEYLKKIEDWLKENEQASKFNPTIYQHYKSLKETIQQKIKDLEKLRELSKKARLYLEDFDGAYNIIGINEDENQKVYGILYNGIQVIKAAVDEIKTDEDEMMEKELDKKFKEPDISLYRKVEQFLRSGDPLKTFFNSFNEGYEPSTKEGVEDFLRDFLYHINNEREMYESSNTFTPKQINDALKKLRDFVKIEGLNVDVDPFIDKSLDGSEEEKLDISKLDKNENKEVKTSSDKLDKKIADALSFLNKIEDILNSFQKDEKLENKEIYDLIEDLQKKIKDIKFNLKESLSIEGDIEKEAAYVVLAHIVKDLQRFKEEYDLLTKYDNFDTIDVKISLANRLLNKLRKIYASL